MKQVQIQVLLSSETRGSLGAHVAQARLLSAQCLSVPICIWGSR